MRPKWLRHLSVTVVSTLFLSCGGGGGDGGGGGSPPPGGNPPPGAGMMLPPPPVAVLTDAELNAQRTPEFLRSFGLESVKTEYSLARGGTGKGVTIAILEVGNSRLYCADCFLSPSVLPSDRIYADLYWLPDEPGQPGWYCIVNWSTADQTNLNYCRMIPTMRTTDHSAARISMLPVSL